MKIRNFNEVIVQKFKTLIEKLQKIKLLLNTYNFYHISNMKV